METTMRKRKVTNKFKIAAAGILSAGVISAGAFSLGAASGNVADANPSNVDTHQQDALIISAADQYDGTQHASQGLAYLPQQVFDIQTAGSNARAHIYNGDSGANVYLHYGSMTTGAPERWYVAAEGQAGLDQTTADQYGMPDNWVTDQSW